MVPLVGALPAVLSAVLSGVRVHMALLGVHIVVDAAKERYKKIGYVADQVIHYVVLLVYFV